MMKYTLYAFILVFTLLQACKKNKRFYVDPEAVNIEMDVVRFDQLLEKDDTVNMQKRTDFLSGKYPEFFRLYTSQVIKIGSPQRPDFEENLKKYITDSIYCQVFDSVTVSFKNTDEMDATLRDGFKRYHYFFPDRAIPHVYYMISGFNESIVTCRDILAISLEDYLGSNHTFYKWLALYDYLKINMYPKKIPSDALWAWLQTEFPFRGARENLLSHMVQDGKILFALQQFLPEEPLNRILSYSEKELQWCEANEPAMWTYLIEQKHLFSKDELVIKKYTDQAPFTQFFGQESAPRAGSYVGFKIVSSFMENNKDVTLEQMMKLQNAQMVLEKSGYKP